MIVLKLIGGLGNQMFEYAFARNLQILLKENLYFDCSIYNKYKIRKYSLGNLNICSDIQLLDNANINKIQNLYLIITQKLYRVIQKLIRIIKKTDRIGNKFYNFLLKRGLYYNFDRYYYDTLICNKKTKCIYGYFQSEKYFMDIKPIVKEELKVKTCISEKEKELLKEIEGLQSVGISIREGDDFKYLKVCDMDFYYTGMDIIASRLSDPVFFIFSDCLEKVKKEYKFKYRVKFIEDFEDYQSLRLLYSCKHFVISNSSFSWWGAYLSDNNKKIIIAPNKWNNNSVDKPDIYYNSMELINV